MEVTVGLELNITAGLALGSYWKKKNKITIWLPFYVLMKLKILLINNHSRTNAADRVIQN